MVAYLSTLVMSYFVAGVLIALGAARILEVLGDLLSRVPIAALGSVQIGLGLLLVGAGAVLLHRVSKHRHQSAGGALHRWREQALTAGSSAALMRLAILAFAVEFATMFPYLAAIGMLTTADMPFASVVAWIAVYCLIMVLPAAIATVVRVAAHHRVQPALSKLDSWLSQKSPILSGTVIAIIGSFLVIDATLALTGVTLNSGHFNVYY